MSQIPDKADVVRLESFSKHDHVDVVSHVSEFEEWSDLKLWQEFKKGSRSAFVFIYHRYFDRLYNYGHQFTHDTGLIKDCIQDLFIELNYSKSRLSDTHSIHLYLYKAVKRKIIKTLKNHKKSLWNGKDELFAYGFNIELSIEQKIINRQIADEQILKLNDSVNKLTYRQREAIFYFYYEGFSLTQVRELMEMQSLKATQNLIYKAVKELRKLLVFLPLPLSFIS